MKKKLRKKKLEAPEFKTEKQQAPSQQLTLFDAFFGVLAALVR
jgi:hypothetical protein